MRTALVISGQTDFRRIIASILEKQGFSVSHADDPSQGVDACTGGMPDLILLDAEMKTGGSLSTASLIRHLDDGEKPKIIAVTRSGDADKIARMLKDGANQYLVRPFDSQAVRETLQEVGLG